MADRVIDFGAGDSRRVRDSGAGIYVPEVYIANPSVPVSPPTPAAADVVGGTGAAGATILTVPAGRTWRGVVALAAAASAAIGTAAATVVAAVNVAGAGATPAAGALVQMALALPITLAAATNGAAQANSVSLPDVVVIAPAGNAVTLTVTADAGVEARGTARGVLL